MADTQFYITVQGQTWDEISLDVYGTEAYADVLMQNNYDLLDTLIFSAGVIVYTPEIAEETGGDEPPWTSSDEESDVDPYE